MNLFIADTHFYHKNIIEYCNRPFSDIEAMNSFIIEKWNSVVKSGDTVYHLGDVALCSDALLRQIRECLNGQICLVRGNHDNRSISKWEDLGFIVLRNAPVILEKEKFLFSHVPQPDSVIPDGFINVHGHIHNKLLNQCSYHNGDKNILEYPPESYSVKKHICVSAEMINYTPISLKEIRNISNNKI